MTLRRLAVLSSFLVMGAKGQITPGCLYTMEQLILNEERITDFNSLREYVICEGRVIEIGVLDIDNKIVAGSGSPMFPLRPNLHIKCGGNGNRDNNCLINGGDVQVDGTNFFGVSSDLDLTNIVMEGFTFVGASRYSVWGTKKGDITFVDCEWRDIVESYAPIYFDFYDPSSRQDSLRVDFVGCTFNRIRYFGDGSAPAIITANGEQNMLLVDRCDFENNDFVFNNTLAEKNSFLIESSGQLRISRSCFTNNTVGVAPAIAYATVVTADANYGDESDGGKCPFLGVYETSIQFDALTPVCSNYGAASRCLSDTTEMPSTSPSIAPTTAPPTNLPTSPSAAPSTTPSDFPSLHPTTTFKPSTSLSPTTETQFPSSVPSFPSVSINGFASAATTGETFLVVAIFMVSTFVAMV